MRLTHKHGRIVIVGLYSQKVGELFDIDNKDNPYVVLQVETLNDEEGLLVEVVEKELYSREDKTEEEIIIATTRDGKRIINNMPQTPRFSEDIPNYESELVIKASGDELLTIPLKDEKELTNIINSKGIKFIKEYLKGHNKK